MVGATSSSAPPSRSFTPTHLFVDQMERHGVGGVRRVRTAGQQIDHLFGIAVIGGDERGAACFTYPFSDPAETRVDVLAGFDCLIEFPGVADHVGIREVDDKNIRLTFINAAQKLVRDFERRHFGLQIVCRDLRRRNQQALFACKLRLHATVEEVSDVRVLLSLGETIVAHAQPRTNFRQHVRWCRGGNAIGRSNVWSYIVKQTKSTLGRSETSNSLNPATASVRVSWRARSGRKLKKMMLSSSLIVATGSAVSRTITIGSTNSSVTPRWYDSLTAAIGSFVRLPSPWTSRS